MYSHPLLALVMAHDLMQERERVARGRLSVRELGVARARRRPRLRGLTPGIAFAALGLPRPSAAPHGC